MISRPRTGEPGQGWPLAWSPLNHPKIKCFSVHEEIAALVEIVLEELRSSAGDQERPTIRTENGSKRAVICRGGCISATGQKCRGPQRPIKFKNIGGPIIVSTCNKIGGQTAIDNISAIRADDWTIGIRVPGVRASETLADQIRGPSLEIVDKHLDRLVRSRCGGINKLFSGL